MTADTRDVHALSDKRRKKWGWADQLQTICGRDPFDRRLLVAWPIMDPRPTVTCARCLKGMDKPDRRQVEPAKGEGTKGNANG